MKKKVMVGMSGGVDSSVAAALLLDQGYDVTGATMKLWDGQEDHRDPGTRTCCSVDDVEDARAVAASLEVPFYVLNMKSQFREKVVDPFVDSYLNGETPNPCMECNRHLKFQAMLDKALSLGFDYIATGHYAIVEFDETRGKYVLRKGSDATKDQSYFLYMLTQDLLGHVLFPLGTMSKTQIRAYAGAHGMRVRNKPDSQDICFVENGKYQDFIQRESNKPITAGNFLDLSDKVLGRHKGITAYTVGQRKGLGISSAAPLYVVGKNAADNTVILGAKSDTLRQEFLVRDVTYTFLEEPTEPFQAKVKVRYSADEVEAMIYPLEDGRVRVQLIKPYPFVAPGQAAVFYQDDLVLGGGIISA